VNIRICWIGCTTGTVNQGLLRRIFILFWVQQLQWCDVFSVYAFAWGGIGCFFSVRLLDFGLALFFLF